MATCRYVKNVSANIFITSLSVNHVDHVALTASTVQLRLEYNPLIDIINGTGTRTQCVPAEWRPINESSQHVCQV